MLVITIYAGDMYCLQGISGNGETLSQSLNQYYKIHTELCNMVKGQAIEQGIQVVWGILCAERVL